MKTYLLDSINRLKRFGENLDAKTILCNKSWQIFNDTDEKELYIFQENGNILLSTNGIVCQGRWQYISANKTILISIKDNSFLLHPSFSINNIIAMNLDGTERYMLMIDEQSNLALKLKSIEDLNKYFLSLEDEDEKKSKEEEQTIEKEVLKKEAMKAWSENKNRILYSNKEYKYKKMLSKAFMIVSMLAPLIIVLFVLNNFVDIKLALIGLITCIFFLIEFCLFDHKCNIIGEKERNIFMQEFDKKDEMP